MSKTPIFKLEKIKHETVKHKKDFILDMIFVDVAVAVLYVATYENHNEGVKKLHKNKDRKEYKKIKELHDDFASKRDTIHHRMTQGDLNVLDVKFKATSKAFIQSVGLTDKDVCLEYLAIAILRGGLLRENRKTPLRQEFKAFTNFRTHKKIIDLIEKAKDYKNKIEPQLALDFVSKVRY